MSLIPSLRRGLLLAAGLLVLPAVALHAQANSASLVANSNLETDANADGWPDKWPKLKAGGSWELENGNHFIRMTATAPGATTMLYAEIPVPAGTPALEVTWRWRISGLKPGQKPWFDARLMMEFADAQRKKTAVRLPPPTAAATPPAGWKKPPVSSCRRARRP